MSTSRNMSILLASALTTAVALPASAASGPAPTPTFSSEKCFGIAAKNANDCQTSTHSCAGQSTRARDPESWLYVPAGTCGKIDGASLTAKKA